MDGCGGGSQTRTGPGSARIIVIGDEMKKSDIKMHGEHGRYYPAINVKVYRLPWDADTVAKHFNCDDATAKQAAQYCFESEQEQFWDDAKGLAEMILGKSVSIYSGGRSGGWLEVDGLPEVESWDAIMLGKWARFAKAVKDEIEYRTSWEVAKESIKANRWAENGAEYYNFIDRKNGETVCIADLKRGAKAAGFGPVIR